MTNPPTIQSGRKMYWRRTRQLTMTLLGIWFASTFTIIFFARELSAISFFGWPLSFYLAAQGAVLLYTVLIGIHTYKMSKFDEAAEKDHGAE